MTWRVLISAPYFLSVLDEFRPRLEAEDIQVVTVQARERLSEDALLATIETIDGVICGNDRFTGRVLRAAPRLKVISKWGTGIDSIDTDVAAELGIRVCNTPDAFTDVVAETTLGYLLCFARRIPFMDRDMRRGIWAKLDAISLKECTLGVVGLGNIGKAVARRARAFGMTVLATDPIPVDESFVNETRLRLVSLPELLAEADFVSLHCDLNPTSFHLIGHSELAAMRSSAYLINTSRGPVVDEEALVEALREHRIAGAALDVFEIEPLPMGSPLRALDNCLLAPHNANRDFNSHRKVHESTIANLIKGLREAG